MEGWEGGHEGAETDGYLKPLQTGMGPVHILLVGRPRPDYS